MDSFLQDLKHSLRMFAQSPAFTLTAIAALALGVGANTAIFSLVNRILLDPPPFPEAGRIVVFMNTSPQGSGPAASPAKFAHWARQTDVIEHAAAYRGNVINWTGTDAPEQLRSVQCTRELFALFGAPVIMGRGFSVEEDRPKGPAVALISESLWRTRWKADAAILGKTIELGGVPHAIIGVVGSAFDFRDLANEGDVYVPFQLDPETSDQGHYFQSAARLEAGVTLQQAQTRLKESGAEFQRRFPRMLQNGQGFSVEPLQEVLVRDARSSILVLAAAVGLVLLIACANVANLLLARAIGRKREIAIRAALGAGRGRLIRQLLVESLLLGSAGAIAGFVIGVIGMRALLAVNTAGLPRVGEDGSLVGVDWRVLAFTVALSLLTSLLFGLIPALQSSRADLGLTLKESGGRTGSGFRQNKARTALVVAQLALAVVLVIGAALLIRTTLALAGVKPGYDAHNVLTMRMSLAGPRYEKSAALEQLVRSGLERLNRIPGVEMASASCCIPLEGGYGLPFRIMGRALEGNAPYHGGGGWQTPSPGFFEVFKIPVIQGRTFTDRDSSTGPPVVIINQAMAKQYWPKGDPLQDQILIGKGVMSELATEVPRQIVGVVADIRDGSLNRDPGPTMYVPNGQIPDALNALNVRISPLAWVIRTRGNPTPVATAAREELRQVSGLPLANIRSMEEVIDRSTSRDRFRMLLMTVFGLTALFLAAIGVYGLMAYSVQQRTQEIGILMALGAQTGQVRTMVLRQGMQFALAGIAVGTGAAFGLARFLAAFLYGVTQRDPFVFAGVPVLLTAIAALAILLPAMRATRVDPVAALRCD
ncbi:MAG: ABC transporter permease [Bryobacteraceae bacterium]